MTRADHRYCLVCAPRLHMATVKFGVVVLRAGRKTQMITAGFCDQHARDAVNTWTHCTWRAAMERDAVKASRLSPPILDAAERSVQ